VQHYQIPGTNVHLLDTPGFDDPNLSDTDILTMISTCLEDYFNDEAEIRGALYIHPITEARMKRSGMTNLRMFKDIIGMDKMANVRLVTTKWSLQPRDKLEAHEKDLATEQKFWKPLLGHGASIVRFADSWQSAMEILRPLVTGQPFIPLLLKERVFDGLSIPQTQAGQVVNDNVAEAIKAGEKQVKELDDEWRQAMRDKQDDWAAELLKEKQEHQAELEKAMEERRRLQELNSQRSRGRFGRWAARVGAVVVGGIATVATFGAAAPAAVALYGAVEAGAQIHKASSN